MGLDLPQEPVISCLSSLRMCFSTQGFVLWTRKNADKSEVAKSQVRRTTPHHSALSCARGISPACCLQACSFVTRPARTKTIACL